MDAEAERGVAVLGAVDDDLVGAVEELGVAVGGRERQQHPLVGLHRAAVEVVSSLATMRAIVTGA